MLIFRPTIWLSLLVALLCSLAGTSPALSQETGTSCLGAWSAADCPGTCTLAALQPKAVSCPTCHPHPGLPLPLKARGELFNPNKRLDQTSFISLDVDPGQRGRRTPPPQLLIPRRPLLPNQTLAVLSTVVLRN